MGEPGDSRPEPASGERAGATGAEADITTAISGRGRVRDLADFLGVPVQALAGGLIDAVRADPDLTSARRDRPQR